MPNPATKPYLKPAIGGKAAMATNRAPIRLKVTAYRTSGGADQDKVALVIGCKFNSRASPR